MESDLQGFVRAKLDELKGVVSFIEGYIGERWSKGKNGE